MVDIPLKEYSINVITVLSIGNNKLSDQSARDMRMADFLSKYLVNARNYLRMVPINGIQVFSLYVYKIMFTNNKTALIYQHN